MTDEFDDRSASAPQGAGAGGARTGWTPGGGWGGDDVDDENWDDWDDIELSDKPSSEPASPEPASSDAAAQEPVAEEPVAQEPVAQEADESVAGVGADSAPEAPGGNDLASAAAAWLMKREPAAPPAETLGAVADELSAVESAGEADAADADEADVDAADVADAADDADVSDEADAADDADATDEVDAAPVVVPEPPKLTIPLPTQPIAQTGHRAVDEALRSLDNAAGLPVAEQVAAFEAAHRTLRETLTTIDEA
ncbi:MAG TPA: hypothetical protein VGF17_20320 [Phytomonospora sp.]